jgi:hypothetical protein
MSAEGIGKKWYMSRGVWIAVLTFLIGASDVIIELIRSEDYSAMGIAMAVAGILKFAERMTSNGEPVNL